MRVFVLFLCIFLFRVKEADAHSLANREFVPGEILVSYKRGTNLGTIQRSMRLLGHTNTMSIRQDDSIQRIKLKVGEDVHEAMLQYNLLPEVIVAEPNYYYYRFAEPNDSYYSHQWAAKNSGQTVSDPGIEESEIDGAENPGESGSDASLEEAWDHRTDCSSVTVAVIDSGINYNHTDLDDNLWDGGITYPNHGYDFADNDDDPMDLDGHGTHVAGIIGAEGNNSSGTAGVCWNAEIMGLKVFPVIGGAATSDIIEAIDFAIDRGASIINMSLGGSSYSSLYRDALERAKDAGVLVVVAAGNEGSDNDDTAIYPCNFDLDNILCVGALDQDYGIASYSNYGTSSVDVAAPGTNIISAWPITKTLTQDMLTTGWNQSTTGSSWAYGAGPYANYLVIPAAYDRSAVSYVANTNSSAWKAFDLSDADYARFIFQLKIDTEAGYDTFRIGYRTSDANPFAGGSLLDIFEYMYESDGAYSSLSGSSSNSFYTLVSDSVPSSCLNPTCAFGFRLYSDVSNQSYGLNVRNFYVEKRIATTEFGIISGTSMATPLVAGIAAMVWAHNEDYTYADVIDAIYNGGDVLPGLQSLIRSGKAVDAMGALSYIQPPTGLEVVGSSSSLAMRENLN